MRTLLGDNSISGDKSRPVTRIPRAANSIASLPVPQATSSTVHPAKLNHRPYFFYSLDYISGVCLRNDRLEHNR